ncbi:MAG TPA: hypothetical protein VNA87_02045 [Actinomycetota bacterium]|nr:hypothetical protein [Actinomycetota bacterium]
MRTWIRLAAASLVAAGVLAAATVPVSAHEESTKSSEVRKAKKQGSCQAKMVKIETKKSKALAELNARFESKKSDPEWEGRSEELAAKYEKKRQQLESSFSKKSLRKELCAKKKKK